VFEGPKLIELNDRFDYGEDRWFGIGLLDSEVAVVVWTERQNGCDSDYFNTKGK
jgi:uncharacterized DUF497 family protein